MRLGFSIHISLTSELAVVLQPQTGSDVDGLAALSPMVLALA